MAGDVVIRITLVDGASEGLRKIGKAATQAANEMDKAGKKGSKSLDDIDQKAKKADQQMRTFERTSLAVGAALGATALAVIKVSAAYQNQERQLAALNRLYGDSGKQMIAYAETIQNTTKFSNDAARDSAIVLNTLVQNYGLATGQIEQLISRSTDLAQLHGKSLTEVSQMVSNALRGEGEYIEQIGVTLNQTFVAQQAAARGMKNFISEMTAAEQAAFRFTLLMEQTATAQGYATETATGMRGAIGLMINEFGDGTQAIGGMLGPVRDLAAEFQNYALWMPLIGSQMGRMFAILKNSATDGKNAARAMTLLRFAMNPLTLVVGALAVGLGVLGIKYLENKQAAAQLAAQNEMAAQSYKTLNDSITQMYMEGDTQGAKFSQNQVTIARDFVKEWQNAIDIGIAGDEGGFIDSLESSVGSIFSTIGQNEDSVAAGIGDYFERVGTTYNREALENMKLDPATEAQIYSSMNQLLSLQNNPSLDIDAFQAETSAFFKKLWFDVATGAIPPEEINDEIDKFTERMGRTLTNFTDLVDQFDFQAQLDDLRIKGMDDVAADLEQFASMYERIINVRAEYEAQALRTNPDASLFGLGDLDLTAGQIDTVTQSMERIQKLMASGDFDNPAINQALDEVYQDFVSGRISGEQYADTIEQIALNFDDLAAAAFNFAAAGKAVREGAFGAADEAIKAATAIQEEQAKQREEMIAAAAQAIEEYNTARADFLTTYYEAFQMDDPVSKINLSSLRNEFTGLAGDMANAASQLETVFRVVVENTNAIGGQAQSVADWADGLFEVVDGTSKIGDLLSSNFINQTQYNAALEAQGQIQEANSHIQRDVLTIQAMQAPLIAEQTQALEAQMHLVSNMPIEQQRVTLGWMDAQTAGQAYTLMTQAAQVATGELGAVGETAFKSMIEGAVAVNPLLFDMLETIGLVSGTPLDFTVNLDGVTEGMSEIERLTMSIDALIVQLGGIPPNIDLGVNVEGEDEISSVMQKINEWGGLTDTNINVGVEVDNEGLSNFQDIVNRLTNSEPITVPAKVEVSQDNAGLASFQNIVNNLMGVEPVKVPAQLDLAGTIETPEPVEVPVTFDTTNAVLPTMEPVSIPVIFDTADAVLPTMEPVSIPVTFDIDASAITNAMAEWSMGGVVTGPIVKFGKEDGEVHMALGDWQAVGDVDGPVVKFYMDATIPQTSLDRWTGMGDVNGPVVKFYMDATIPQASLDRWTGMGTVTGPIVVFTANTSEVASALQAYSGSRVIGTRIVDIVTRRSTVNGSGGYWNERHGGIPGMAHGGILIHAAENNRPEIATFANGGTARLSQEGNYMVPPHTLITPSNVNRDSGGDIKVYIQTGDWYGGSRPDLDEWASDSLIPAIAEEFGRDETASGRAA